MTLNTIFGVAFQHCEDRSRHPGRAPHHVHVIHIHPNPFDFILLTYHKKYVGNLEKIGRAVRQVAKSTIDKHLD